MNPHLAKARDAVERFADFDPATLYEAAGRTGMVDPAIRPAWHGAKVCGLAVTVECPPGDNLMLHVAVARARPGVVIVATACSKEKPGTVDAPIQLGGATVRSGDLIFGNADGLVIVEQDRIEEVYEAAVSRSKRETEIITKLRQGRTTMELLGLADPRQDRS